MNKLRRQLREAAVRGHLPQPLIAECAQLYLRGDSFRRITEKKGIPAESARQLKVLVKRIVAPWPPKEDCPLKGPVLGAAAVPAGEESQPVRKKEPPFRVAPQARPYPAPKADRSNEDNVTALLTVDQVAQRLSISPQTLANWRATGRYQDQLPFLKIGSSVRYRSEDVARVEREGFVKA